MIFRKSTIFLLLWLVITSAIKAQDLPIIKEIHLSPDLDKAGKAVGLHVQYSVQYETNQEHNLKLLFNSLHPYLDRTTDVITQLSVTDTQGAVTYRAYPDTSINDLNLQVWKGNRAVKGKTIKIDYHIPVAVSIPKRRGPHIDLQATGGGLAGAFTSFLLYPETLTSVDLSLKWHLPKGFIAVTSKGENDCQIKTDLGDLMFCQFIVGKMFTYPDKGRDKGFSLYALGRKSDEMKQAAVWVEKVYAHLRNRLNGNSESPFRIFIRTYDGGPLASGVAVMGGYTLYLPPTEDATTADIHSLIAHETVHAFVGSLHAQEGEDDWYSEGIADYLCMVLPLEAGLYTPVEFGKLINEEAALYYTNAIREVSEKDISSVKWSGRNAWSIGYSRGAMYFANLEAKLKRTHSQATVVGLINQITQQAQAGEYVTKDTWEKLLATSVGQWAVDDWRRMLSGKLIVPEPDIYEGYTVKKITTGLFDLGFAKPMKVQKGEIVQGVDPNSEAAKAGLQEGDEILASININKTYTSYSNTLTIPVLRKGRKYTITFQPRKGSVEAYEFVKKQ